MKQKPLTHGGDWVGFEEEYGFMPLDLSANVSPFGVPEGVKKAIAEAAERADLYPDPLCRSLRASLSEHSGLPAAHILCGNGAADIIFRLALAKRPKKALVLAPTFSEYRTAMEAVQCEVKTYLLKEERDFRVGEDILDAIGEDIDIVFLCEPNNPTGLSDSEAFLAKILSRVEEIGGILFIDECFHDFLTEPEVGSMIPYVETHPSLIVLKAFTKMYGMAGVRLGYCLCSDEELLQKMLDRGQPWSVSSLAQAAGIAAVGETAYVEHVRAHMDRERPRLMEGLRNFGFRVVPGEANYLLFRAPADLAEKLRRKGVVIRSCSNYDGLDENWFRSAVRTEEETDRLLAAIKEVL